MQKIADVMTRSLATSLPDAPVAQVARMMRDVNIGDVLVVDDSGKLLGIVTDRDLAVRALSSDEDMRMTPVHDYMTTAIVTGQPSWSLSDAAKIMSEHQVRRLPIVDGGRLVGIVSLGDVAIHSKKEDVVSDSLRAISETGPARSPAIGKGLMGLLGLAAAVGGAILFATDMGKHLRGRFAQHWPELSQDLMDYGERIVATGSKEAGQLRQRVMES